MKCIQPDCYSCKYLKEFPQFIGDSGKCEIYPENIDESIFYNGKRCDNYNPGILEAKEES